MQRIGMKMTRFTCLLKYNLYMIMQIYNKSFISNIYKRKILKTIPKLKWVSNYQNIKNFKIQNQLIN